MPKPLRADEIHVWTAALDGRAMQPTDLDAGERSRAESFSRPDLRADFIRTRTVLRRVLALYLACDPAGLVFTQGRHGKPALADHPGLRFNASHSGGCLVVAVRRDQPIGVDVERRRDMPNACAIARRFFTAAEADQIEALPEARRADGFRALWTLKEAIVKAEGEALIHHLDRIECALAAGGLARFVAWHGMEAGLQSWSVVAFCPAAGYAAMLATPPPAEKPTFLRWNGDGL